MGAIETLVNESIHVYDRRNISYCDKDKDTIAAGMKNVFMGRLEQLKLPLDQLQTLTKAIRKSLELYLPGSYPKDSKGRYPKANVNDFMKTIVMKQLSRLARKAAREGWK